MDNKKNIKDILRHTQIIKEGEEEIKPTESEYQRVKSLLENDMINHSGIIRELWDTSNATNRSLFRKKLNRDKNDSGGRYGFSKEEKIVPSGKLWALRVGQALAISSADA